MSVQRDDAWLKSATPEQVAAAQSAGELDDLLGRTRYEADKALNATIASTPDRIIAAAYGSTPGTLAARRDLDSTWFAAARADMTPEQRAKLEWVEGATPADVYAAEQAGELDNLTGRDVAKEEARIAEITARVRAAVTQH